MREFLVKTAISLAIVFAGFIGFLTAYFIFSENMQYICTNIRYF